ncbi:MAG: PCP reductase family protein [bacterium]
MKLLCVSCDTQMKLEETTGPVEGSLSVSFACPSCAHRIALLTNPGETQLVRALDVKIGGRSSPAEPWEFVRTMLAARGEDVGAREEGSTASAEPSSRDFGETSASSVESLSRDAQAEGLGAGPRCPFSAVANRAAEAASLTWDPSAEKRLERVPDFIRPMARQGIERFAAERGFTRITEEVIDEVRGTLGF